MSKQGIHIFIRSIPDHISFQDTALALALLLPHNLKCLMSFLTAGNQNSRSLQYCRSCIIIQPIWKVICQNVPESHGAWENLVHGV